MHFFAEQAVKAHVAEAAGIVNEFELLHVVVAQMDGSAIGADAEVEAVIERAGDVGVIGLDQAIGGRADGADDSGEA